MAVTTVPESVFKHLDTGVYTLFGQPVPKNILQVEVGNDLDGGRKVMWVTKNDPWRTHKMCISDVDNDTVTAVIAAMRLTC